MSELVDKPPEVVAQKMRDTFNVCGDRWFKIAADLIEAQAAALSRPSPSEDVVADVIRGAWEACGEVPFPLYDREAKAMAAAVLALINAPAAESDVARLREALTKMSAAWDSLEVGHHTPQQVQRWLSSDVLRDAVAGMRAALIGTGDGWREIESAPKNSNEVELYVPKSGWPGFYRVIGHWACDLSGSEQPPFKGWFRDTGNGFAEISGEPTHWRPLPPPPSGRETTGGAT